MKHTYTICPHCGCGCGLYLVEQDGVLSGTTAGQTHPFSQGQLCARGWTCHQLPGSGKRLRSPLTGEPGKLAPAGWEEAADRAAELLKKARDRHGAGSIGVVASSRLTQSEAWAVRSLAQDVLGTPHFDGCASLSYVPLGLNNGASYEDIGRADLIMVVGADLLEENPILGARVMSRTKPEEDRPYISPDIDHQVPAKQADLVWVNSRPSELMNAAAARIQPRPGWEWLFLAAMVRAAAAGKACKAEGREKLRESLDPSRMEKLLAQAGMAGKEMNKAAALLESAKAPLLIIGRGLWQQPNAGPAKAAAADLSILLGSLKVMQAATGANDALCREILGAGSGLGYMGMIEAAGAGKIRALVLVGEDPLRSLPGSQEVAKALSSLEALIVIDSFSANKAAASAHVVLPMPLAMEKEGAFRNIEGKDQGFSRAVTPPSGVRGLQDIFKRWAGMLGGDVKDSGQLKPAIAGELIQPVLPEPQLKSPGFTLELGSAYPQLMGGELYAESAPHLAREFSGGWAEMHPDDMTELGIRAGWRARFVTETGKLEAVVKANPRLLRKAVFMPAHFGANALAPMLPDRELRTPVFRDISVKIEKI